VRELQSFALVHGHQANAVGALVMGSTRRQRDVIKQIAGSVEATRKSDQLLNIL
jgi:hypothetical protein